DEEVLRALDGESAVGVDPPGGLRSSLSHSVQPHVAVGPDVNVPRGPCLDLARAGAVVDVDVVAANAPRPVGAPPHHGPTDGVGVAGIEAEDECPVLLHIQPGVARLSVADAELAASLAEDEHVVDLAAGLNPGGDLDGRVRPLAGP